MPAPGEKIEEAKKKVEDATKKASEGYQKAKEVQREVGDIVPFVNDLHLPSLFVGFAGALFAFFLITFIFKTGKLLLKLALLAGTVALIAGGYLSWING
jgi:hypothetical protein